MVNRSITISRSIMGSELNSKHNHDVGGPKFADEHGDKDVLKT